MMPTLESARLLVRPFTLDDLAAVHYILDIELNYSDVGSEGALAKDERMAWLHWTVAGYQQYAQLNQPPFGDRAVVHKQDGKLIGIIGMQAVLDAFEQIPYFAQEDGSGPITLNTPEVGLFYALSKAYRGQGFATEAVTALIDYAFRDLRLKRILATTSYNNLASMAMMRRLGMHIVGNPSLQPPWLQVVGVLESDRG